MKTALVFPGQGSQRPGMLTELPRRDDSERLLDAAEALADDDLRVIAMMGSEEDMTHTRVAQPLLYLADWAWGSTLIDRGLRPVAVAGHSLGEFAALAIAGVFSVEAGLELVVERSKLMADCAAATPGGMTAVLGMDAPAIGAVVDGIDGVWVANDNAPGQVVISGTAEGLAMAADALMEAGARKLVPLSVSGPFHSPLMEPARAAFEALLLGADFSRPLFPVVQNSFPQLTDDPNLIRERLIGQITSPVRWTETMRTLADHGVEALVEAGPGVVLKGLARRMEGITALSVEESGLDVILQEVGA